MKRSEAFPSNYFSKEDVLGHNLTLAIGDVRMETMPSDGNEEKPVMHFQDRHYKPLILNNVNWQACEDAYGVDSIGWVGKLVELYHDPNVMFGKERKGGVRIRIPVGAPALPPRPAAPPVPAANLLNTFAEAVAECELYRIDMNTLKEMLKGEGRTGWNGPRDTPLVRSFIAHTVEQQQQQQVVPPAAQSDEFGDIPF